MNNALKKDEMHTVSEIENMPENVRAELIDGDIYIMSTQSANHQMNKKCYLRDNIRINGDIVDHS